MSARGLFEKRMGWRVGDERSMNIWNDPWILGSTDGRIRCQSIDIRYTLVSHLINHETGTWKRDVFKSITDEDQVQDILSILLARYREFRALYSEERLQGPYQGSLHFTSRSGNSYRHNYEEFLHISMRDTDYGKD